MSKAVMVIVPVVIIGIVAGLALTGVITIPGISPKKALKNAAGMYTEKDGKLAKKKPDVITPIVQPVQKPVAKVKAPEKDVEQGADTLAAVWNEIKTPELLKITANWKDEELAKVLLHMETDKVAKLLAELAKGEPDAKVRVPGNPARASKLSKMLQEQGSIVAVADDPPKEST